MTAQTRIRHLASALLNRESPSKLRAYASFADALKDSDSYEDPALIEIVKEKTKRYRDSLATAARTIESRQLVQNLFVLSYVDALQPLDVLELGGACGASYFELKQLVPNRIRHWSIAETAAMAAAGEELNAADPSLTFHADLVAATTALESKQLAIAQGVLQYTSDPLRVLETLFGLQFAHVYVTRTAVADVDPPVFTRQETDLANHGPGRLPNSPARQSSQPLTLVSADSLLTTVPANYELVFNFVESDDRVLSIGERRVTVRDIGFLARLHT